MRKCRIGWDHCDRENGEVPIGELPCGAVTRESSLSSRTDAERETVRKDLPARGFAEDQADKRIGDADGERRVCEDAGRIHAVREAAAVPGNLQ